jgi:hypothetical protein
VQSTSYALTPEHFDGAILFWEEAFTSTSVVWNDSARAAARGRARPDRGHDRRCPFEVEPTEGGPDTLREIVLDVLGERDIPVLGNVDIGHDPPNLPMPLGVRAEMDADAMTLSLLEPAGRRGLIGVDPRVREGGRDSYVRLDPRRRRTVGWYWHLVEAELRERGHDVVAPDLPCDDRSAGLTEYADTVVEAIGDRTDLVVAAQSLRRVHGPLVCERVAVDLLVLIAPMIPVPGEAPADYWTDTRYEEEVRERYDDGIALFYQDVPPELASEALKHGRGAVRGPMHEPLPLEAWPDVPTRVLLCRDDRPVPGSLLRRVA